ncbi:hypothetical protein CKS97_20170 [Salmonella enterica subsp. enterica serovar Java]|nr:hypothetical protein [Salmonella enterica subsp. enterica serovar Java]
MGHVVELVHYAAVSVMNNMVTMVWLKLLVKMEARIPVVVNPVVTLIKQHQRLHVAPGTGRKTMKNIFDRLITVIVFLLSMVLASCIVGLMSSGNHAETPWWMLAGLGLFAAISSVGACMWGVKHDHD